MAKRTHGKKYKKQGHGDGKTHKPASSIARPRAERGVEPTQRKDCEDCADDFMEELPEHAPEALETALRS